MNSVAEQTLLTFEMLLSRNRLPALAMGISGVGQVFKGGNGCCRQLLVSGRLS